MILLADDRGGGPSRSRRDLLRIGGLSLALGGAGTPLARALADASGSAPGFVRDKAVLLLFLAGGASQIETFDPKADAPEGIRGVHGDVPTAIPGVAFGATFPELARRAGRLAVVRSFTHGVNDHALAIRHVLTAGNPTGAGMGAVYARLRGPVDAVTAMPTHGIVTTEEVDDQYQKERDRVEGASGPGTLASSCGPFDPARGGETVALLRPTLPEARLKTRRDLLAAVDRLRRLANGSPAIGAMGRLERDAFALIARRAGDALDLDREDPRVVSRYDTSAAIVGHKRRRPCTLGRQLLTARRLIEAGCGFVTVQCSGWDMHADGNNPGMVDGMTMLGPGLDRAVSALLDDLDARGLAEKVLVVVTGDFGRTPKINAKGGRDHWAALSTLAFAGGGLNVGQVIGRSTKDASRPASDPVTPADLMATLMHVLLDLPALRLRVEVPRTIASWLEAGRPVRDLIGV